MDIEKLSKKSKGGARPGAGRKKGEPNRRTVEAQAMAKTKGVTPLEYMLSVMHNDNDAKMRFAAAQAAAPYLHAKLSSVEMNAKVTHRTLAEELNELNELNEAAQPDASSH